MIAPDGTVVDESLDIMRYALSRHDPDAWLAGVCDATMALVATIDEAFKDHLDHYKYPDRYADDPLAHRAAGLAILASFDARLQAFGNLTGPDISLIDIAILPFVRQFAAVDEMWFASQSIPYIQDWLARFLASPLFDAAMAHFPIWKTGDPPTIFPVV
jgi:glutathione S-transferase